MNYTVFELAENKELRNEIVKGDIFFGDCNLDFSLDFINESMRYNHISAFDTLYTLGGDELFEKIIEEGKTCLTKDPNASKTGVCEVNNTDGKYYLKTNASAAAAFSSIVFGLKAWVEFNEESDEKSLYFSDEIIVFDFEDYEVKSDNVRLVLNNSEYDFSQGRSFVEFKDETSGEIIKTFKLDYSDTTISADEITCASPIETRDGVLLGYMYNTVDSALLGFINLDLTCVVAPSFDNIFVSEECRVIGVKEIESGKKVYFSNICAEGECPVLSNRYNFCVTSESVYSWVRVDEYMDIDGCEYKVLFTNNSGNNASVTVLEFGMGNCEKYEVYDIFAYFNPTVFHCKQTKKGVRADKLDFSVIKKLCNYEYGNINVINRLYEKRVDADWLVVEKDGLFGVAEFDKECHLVKMIIPFAFTGIGRLTDASYGVFEAAELDLFGKKGLFSFKTSKYIVPCEYDRIVWDGWNKTITVTKMDFEGVLVYDSDDDFGTDIVGELKWAEPLSRKGDEQ